MNVGDKLYREVRSRYSPTEIREYTVARIANKYLYLEGSDLKVDKNELTYTDKVYSQNNIQFYKSEQEINDRNEADELCKVIKGYFNAYNNQYSLEKLRAIKALL